MRTLLRVRIFCAAAGGSNNGKQNNSYLSSEGTGKLMLKYSLPCVISLLVGTLYNIVDRIFIANADYLGSYGSTAKLFLRLR